MKLCEPAPVFKDTDVVLAGDLTRSQLRGPAVRRLFQGVYALRGEPVTHELRCVHAVVRRRDRDSTANNPRPAARSAAAGRRRRSRCGAATRSGDLSQIAALLDGRSDKGIVRALHAIELADPRAESRPESRIRVWLLLDGLHPEPQYWIEDSYGRVARADLAFPEHKVA
ncbi:MAG TPA: hypothetical protein VHH53_08875, partial [Pseudonocardiaceae bacterium]|nr:hypothetical protein [Pseudonocardiaceae bacterium]